MHGVVTPDETLLHLLYASCIILLNACMLIYAGPQTTCTLDMYVYGAQPYTLTHDFK